mgnify:CR=1 FL=1
MKSAGDAPSGNTGGLFWRVWERIWWIAALGFLAVNAWVVHLHGWMALARFWAYGFIVLGAAVLVYAWRMRLQALDSLGWLPVQARIISSGVSEDVQRSFSSETHGSVEYMIYYYPEVEYEYEVEGRTYRSNRILAVRVNYPEQEARAAAARYQPGMVVGAWCDPRRHDRAVLEPGLAGHEAKYRIPFFVGAGFALLGIAAAVVLRKLG